MLNKDPYHSVRVLSRCVCLACVFQINGAAAPLMQRCKGRLQRFNSELMSVRLFACRKCSSQAYTMSSVGTGVESDDCDIILYVDIGTLASLLVIVCLLITLRSAPLCPSFLSGPGHSENSSPKTLIIKTHVTITPPPFDKTLTNLPCQ